MPRTIAIGDIHGCAIALAKLPPKKLVVCSRAGYFPVMMLARVGEQTFAAA